MTSAQTAKFPSAFLFRCTWAGRLGRWQGPCTCSFTSSYLQATRAHASAANRVLFSSIFASLDDFELAMVITHPCALLVRTLPKDHEGAMGVDLRRKEGGAGGDEGVQRQKRPPRRAAPLRFRFYLGGAVAVHLAAAASLIYGLYLLHPFLLVLFLLGVGLEMNRVRHHLLCSLLSGAAGSHKLCTASGGHETVQEHLAGARCRVVAEERCGICRRPTRNSRLTQHNTHHSRTPRTHAQNTTYTHTQYVACRRSTCGSDRGVGPLQAQRHQIRKHSAPARHQGAGAAKTAPRASAAPTPAAPPRR